MTEDEKKLHQSGFKHIHIIGSVLNYRRSLAMALIKLLPGPKFGAIDPVEHGLPDESYLWSEVDLLFVDLSEHKSDIRPWFFDMSQTGHLPPVIFVDNKPTVDDAGDMVRAGAADYIDLTHLTSRRLSRALLLAASQRRPAEETQTAGQEEISNEELVTSVMPMLQEKAPSYTGSYPDISGMTDEPTEVMPAVTAAEMKVQPESPSEEEAIGEDSDEADFLTTGLIEILDRIKLEKDAAAAGTTASGTDNHFLTTGLMSVLERDKLTKSELPKKKPAQATEIQFGHHWPFTQEDLENRKATVGDYSIRKFIAVGGTASVFMVHPRMGGKALAMKLFDNDLSDEQGKERFMRGYRLIEHINHPNIVDIREVGTSGETAYVVMEYFPSGDLKSRIEEGISRKDAVRYVADIAMGLHTAHDHKILHRDLKPSNILMREDGSLALLDFGIAKMMAESKSNLTQAGQIVGTSHYVSPEQAVGGDMDGRSDLYALGVIMFEMLEGKRPYTGKSPVEIMQQHVRGPLPSLSGANDPLNPVLQRLMAKDPADRFANGEEVVSALSDAVPDLMGKNC